MNRVGVAMAVALACGGCDTVEWDFGGTADAATLVPPSVDASSGGDAKAPAWDGGSDARTPWGNCLPDGGCWTSDLHCNTANADGGPGQCVQCVMRSQCQDGILNHCDLKPGDPDENLCVECSNDGDCNSGTQPSAGNSGSSGGASGSGSSSGSGGSSGPSSSGGSAGSSGSASSSNSICVSHQCVVQCQNGHQCMMKESPICSPTLFYCVSCQAPSDCRTNICSMDGRCVDCEVDSQCFSPKPHCDPRSNTCVACRTDADCNGGLCDPASSTCSSQHM